MAKVIAAIDDNPNVFEKIDFANNTITIQHTVEVQTNLIIVKDSTKK